MRPVLHIIEKPDVLLLHTTARTWLDLEQRFAYYLESAPPPGKLPEFRVSRNGARPRKPGALDPYCYNGQEGSVLSYVPEELAPSWLVCNIVGLRMFLLATQMVTAAPEAVTYRARPHQGRKVREERRVVLQEGEGHPGNELPRAFQEITTDMLPPW